MQDRLLAQVELDHLRHVGVDRLVVGHAGANGVADGHVAGAVGVHQAGAAQRRIGAEHPRVDEVVVDAAVDHVHALRAGGGAHVDEAILHEQVLPFHQFHTHLLRQEGVLEVGAVVHAGRQHHHRGVGGGGGAAVAQGFQQQVGVVRHGRHAVLAEQAGKQPHHHRAVFQHVAHAAGHAQVVLQHVVLAAPALAAGAHDVDPGDVRIDLVGHRHALHHGAVLAVAQHLLGRDQAGLQDLLPVVDVMGEAVERRHALHQAALQHGPFVGRDDARDEVERNQPLGAGAVLVLGAVDGEGDADAAEDHLGLVAARAHGVVALRAQPAGIGLVVRADGAAGLVAMPSGPGLRQGFIHLIERVHDYDLQSSPNRSRIARRGPARRQRPPMGGIGSWCQ